MKDFKLLSSNDSQFFGNYNDIQFGTTSNDINLIDGHTRIRQAITKILLTSTGLSLVDLNYGSDLSKLKFSPIIFDENQSAIRDAILYSLQYLNSIDTSTVTAETLESMDSLEIIPQGTGYIIKVMLKLKDGTTFSVILGD